MARPSFGVSGRWAFATDRSQRARHGRTGTWRGSSARSGGTALTTLSSLASDIFAICSFRTKNITTRSGHTCRCRRMRRFRATSTGEAACYRYQSWVGYITIMFEFEFATSTATEEIRTPAPEGSVNIDRHGLPPAVITASHGQPAYLSPVWRICV